MNEAAPSYPNEQQLAQTALAHVRALCKGNGVKVETITIINHDISMHTLHAGTYLELKPVMNEKISIGKVSVGTVAASREEALKLVDKEMVAAASNPATKAQITSALLGRPDKGFGLNQQAITLDFLKKDFTYQEACTTCRGTTVTGCQKCHGKRTEACIKCNARGLMVCPQCRGTGLLKGVRCTRCQGQRYYPCDLCKKTGVMRCRTCAGSGNMKCPACGAQGWKSHIINLSVAAVTYFEYDGKTIPKGAADMVETYGTAMAKDGKIKIDGRVADDKENAVGASYEATFPYGDMSLTVGKKDISIGVFGYKADLVNVPHFLDKLVQKGIEELEDAAKDVGSVADKIKKASRYRLIAQAFLLASKTDVKRATGALLKKYDAGLSHSMAQKIVLLADDAMSRITHKPRTQGLIAGLAGVAVFTAVYYLAPVRSFIASFLPDARFDVILDIIPVVAGGMVATLATQMAAAGSIRQALGHLLPPAQKDKLIPKAGKNVWIGYAGSAGLCLVMMEVAALLSQPAPWWYETLRGLIIPQ